MQEVVDGRVWAGFHFRGSVVARESVGRKVAQYGLERFFLPTT
jgi:hypothetical protein